MGILGFFWKKGGKILLEENLEKYEIDPSTISQKCLDEIIIETERISRLVADVKRVSFDSQFEEYIKADAINISRYIYGDIDVYGDEVSSRSNHKSDKKMEILEILIKHGVQQKRS